MSLDVATSLLNIAGGRPVPEEPPGFAILAAPRKAARGREKDALFLCLGLRTRGAVPPDRYAQMLHLAATTFFSTAGSVTSALRQTVAVVNQSLLDANLRASESPGGAPTQGGLISAALRGADFYAVQSGPGMLIVARPSGNERFPAALTRPLGLSNNLDLSYFHTAVGEGDYFGLSNSSVPGWSDIALVGLGHLITLTAVAERLKETGGRDFTALVGRFEPDGAAPSLLARGPITTHSLLPRETPRTPTSAVATAPTASPRDIPQDAAPSKRRRWAGLPRLFGRRSVAGTSESVPVARAPANAEAAAPSHLPAFQRQPASEPAEDSSRTAAGANVTYGVEVESAETEPDWAPLLARDGMGQARVESVPVTTAMDEPRAAGEAGTDATATLEMQATPARPNLVANLATRGRAGARRGLQSMARAVGVTLAEAGRALRMLVGRMLPEGMLQRDGLFAVPTSVQIGIALLIPLLVVSASVWAYLDRGRAEQFSAALGQAQWEVGKGRAIPDPLAARPHWEAALDWLARANALQPGNANVIALRQEAQARLDELDWVTRLDYQPLLVGGLGRDTNITHIALAGQDVYALDAARNRVLRLTPSAGSTVTGRYTLDQTFDCAGGSTAGEFTIGTLIDLVLIPGPNLLGADAIVAFDTAGGLLYCPPGAGQPLASYLAPPIPGWIRPAAIEVYADRLYVLDPGSSEIWQYQASGGAFTQPPSRYFTTPAYDFSDVVEFAIAGGDVFLLRKDGRVATCSRPATGEPATCAEVVQYTDPRPGRAGPADRLAGVLAPRTLVYDPPPEPSLYLLDGETAGAYQLSLKLAFVRQFRPFFPLPGPATAVALDGAKRLFVAAGDNIYLASKP